MMEQNSIWEKQPGESDSSWTCFCVYRDMGRERSYNRLVEKLEKPIHITTLRKWGTEFNWVERCRVYDDCLESEAMRLRQERMRDEYSLKLEAYRNDAETISKELMAVANKAMEVVLREIDTRLATPEPLTASELAALIRAATTLTESGMELMADAIGVEEIVEILADERKQRQQ